MFISNKIKFQDSNEKEKNEHSQLRKLVPQSDFSAKFIAKISYKIMYNELNEYGRNKFSISTLIGIKSIFQFLKRSAL